MLKYKAHKPNQLVGTPTEE